jgi:hypothetical protein
LRRHDSVSIDQAMIRNYHGCRQGKSVAARVTEAGRRGELRRFVVSRSGSNMLAISM